LIQLINLVLIFFHELIFAQDFVKGLSWLEECNFIIFLKNNWNLAFFMHLLVYCARISLKLQLMRIFQGSLMRILKINCNGNRKFTVPRIVDFKWVSINSNESFWKTLVNLKLDFLYHKRKVLLFTWISCGAGIPQSANVAPPFVI
jgi:hypothetical protein